MLLGMILQFEFLSKSVLTRLQNARTSSIHVAFCLLEDLTAFCFKTSLRFASRPHCVLLQDLTAFYFKTSLRFASRPHCVLLQDLTAFCFKDPHKHFASKLSLHLGKENGLQILQSIDQGPFELGTTRDTLGTTPEGGILFGPERPHTYEDLSDMEKKRYDADVRATNIVLQGLPKDIYKLINHNIEAKAIWDNVKILLAGLELTKEERESQLYDEFERFKLFPGENINEYYVHFHKLVNDMRNIRMTMPNIQLNSKFVNNMSPEWDRFVTAVKLNKGLKETNHEQLYAYLKQHEKHAAQDRLIIERITPATNDQLAFVSTNQNQNQRYFARGNGAAGNGGAQNRAGNANAGQGKPVKCYNCNGVGHIARNCTQPKRPQNSDYFKDKMLLMQAQENGAVLDEEELLFLAGEQGNTFDADVDNQLVQYLALNEDNIFQADEYSSYILGPQIVRREKKRYDVDVRATNIVLQGLPKDIYKLINYNIAAKAIWDNVIMLLAGSELTKEDRESQLYDEFEGFKMLPI
ncbi:retrovirus-related pol polyprotein from transposon TNT 1-94 [Tanacetum coccineum]